MTTQPQEPLLKQAEAWWAFLARVLAFFLGVVILVAEQQGPGKADLFLVIAGIGCIGPAVAQSVATMFIALRGGQNDAA